MSTVRKRSKLRFKRKSSKRRKALQKKSLRKKSTRKNRNKKSTSAGFRTNKRKTRNRRLRKSRNARQQSSQQTITLPVTEAFLQPETENILPTSGTQTYSQTDEIHSTATSTTISSNAHASEPSSATTVPLTAPSTDTQPVHKPSDPEHAFTASWQPPQANIRYTTFNLQSKSDDAMTDLFPISSKHLVRRITVIILAWNALDYTRSCLDAIRSSCENNAMVDVIVLDNGSTDGTADYLKTQSWIKPIFLDYNSGFVAGNNIAINQADPNSDIVLLNNDIRNSRSDWLKLLQETAMSTTDIGIVGCRLRGSDGSLHHAGTYIMPDNLMGQQIGGLETDVRQYIDIRDVQGIVFACAYIKRELLKKIGPLDSDYFSYFDDTDYCYKSWYAGYRVVYDGRLTMMHHHNTSTRVNGVDFWEMYEKSQNVFRSKWQEKLFAKYKTGVTWRSVVNLPLFGYAESSRNFMNALEQQNVMVSYRYVYGPGSPIELEEPAEATDMRIQIYQQRQESLSNPGIVYGQGDAFLRNPNRYKIGFTMLEVDGLPNEWIRQSNEMNEVWVPSSFNMYAFRESGVRVPIHIMPLGVDTQYFHPHVNFNRFSPAYTFLSVFEWGERKAPELLFRAFRDAFQPHDDVHLVCKITNNDPSIDIASEIRKLNLGASAEKITFIFNQRIPSHQMGSLYRSADCFVLPTRGEGWGMPIMEAMACGLPVITTDWSAPTSFMNENNAFPIPVRRLIPAEARCIYYEGLNWADPDYDHLVYVMRYVYNNRAAAQEIGAKAAKQIAERWTWHHAATRIKSRLEQLS
ncbi:glycosyltransferase [Paenibacillus sp. SC116]|uniref:glycosyltransferase n=1 Tax=Paenibacillus sp. SC116 TaxID=2968986 RepID=UPI00215AB7FE|nr:glycosyltransferase [Paenibacillus sp. SC116]